MPYKGLQEVAWTASSQSQTCVLQMHRECIDSENTLGKQKTYKKIYICLYQALPRYYVNNKKYHFVIKHFLVQIAITENLSFASTENITLCYLLHRPRTGPAQGKRFLAEAERMRWFRGYIIVTETIWETGLQFWSVYQYKECWEYCCCSSSISSYVRIFLVCHMSMSLWYWTCLTISP